MIDYMIERENLMINELASPMNLQTLGSTVLIILVLTMGIGRMLNGCLVVDSYPQGHSTRVCSWPHRFEALLLHENNTHIVFERHNLRAVYVYYVTFHFCSWQLYNMKRYKVATRQVVSHIRPCNFLLTIIMQYAPSNVLKVTHPTSVQEYNHNSQL